MNIFRTRGFSTVSLGTLWANDLLDDDQLILMLAGNSEEQPTLSHFLSLLENMQS
jgi:hypothetical protein